MTGATSLAHGASSLAAHGASSLAAHGASSLAAHGASWIDALTGRPVLLLLGLAALSLIPFAFVMLTSFLKISVVLSLLRSALGTPQIPPNAVVTGLAAALTLFVMAPVGAAMLRAAQPDLAALDASARAPDPSGLTTARALWTGGAHAAEPLRGFLSRNAHPRDVAAFLELAREVRAPEERAGIGAGDFLVVVPAFITSQLKEAFEIGFLVFVPFLVIDLVVSNVLLALGMQMLSPTTVSLPFKLLLFVLVDGWFLLARGLVLGYH